MTETADLLTKIIATLEKYQSRYPAYFDHFENILVKTRIEHARLLRRDAAPF